MKIVSKNLFNHLFYTLLRKAYIHSYWKAPHLLPDIKYPHTIEIELTNDCNFSCIHCHRRKMDRNVEYMALQVFKTLIDEIAQHPVPFLRMVGQGESALHPQLSEMMRYAAKKSIKLELTTNGSLFELHSTEEIMSWDLDIIGVSIDGIDKETYQKIRKGGNYDQLTANISEFHSRRREANKKYPMVCVRDVIFPDYKSEQIENYKEVWQDISDQITFNTLARFDESSTPLNNGYKRCSETFFDAHIRCDGSVLLCQHQFLFGPNEVIGNIKEQSLREIWTSERLNEIRTLHKNRDFPQTCMLCLQNIKSEDVNKNSRQYNTTRNGLTKVLNRVINLT